MLKKLFAALLAMMLLLPMCAYAAPEVSEDAGTDMELLDKAGVLTRETMLMCGLEGFTGAFSGSDEINALAKEALGYSYAEVKRSLVVRIDADAANELLAGVMGVSAQNADVQLQEALRTKALTAAPMRLNSMQGVNWLATASILNGSDAMTLKDVSPCMAYVISEYYGGDGQPLTYAAFNVKSDGMALACAGVLKVSDEQRAALFDNDSAECISVLFDDMGAELGGVVFYKVYDRVRIDE